MSFFKKPGSVSSDSESDFGVNIEPYHDDNDVNAKEEVFSVNAFQDEITSSNDLIKSVKRDKRNNVSLPENTTTNTSHDLGDLSIDDSTLFDSKFTTVFNQIRKETRLSVLNRLHSIVEDANFVQEVAEYWQLPIIANERCGSWYIPPTLKAGSAYFKSTDGHFGQWSFSTRRLNLHLLRVITENDGCIIVDSTRRGKSIPDALSKTVPIWCNVLNKALFPGQEHRLWLPTNAVSESEASRIQERVNSFVENLKSIDLAIPDLQKLLQRPLRPFWITPDVDICLPDENITSHFYPVICVSCSKYLADKQETPMTNAEGTVYTYIQGAGDDHEGWSHGLNPVTFWEHKDLLLRTKETAMKDTIKNVLENRAKAQKEGMKEHESEKPILKSFSSKIFSISKTGAQLAFTDLATAQSLLEQHMHQNSSGFSHYILCETGTDKTLNVDITNSSPGLLRVCIPTGKSGSKALRHLFPQILAYVHTSLHKSFLYKLLIACPTGNDIAVGIALAVICLFYDNNGSPRDSSDSADLDAMTKHITVDKAMIKKRLGWIVSEHAIANPSRSTLLAVNSYLMPGVASKS